MTEPAGSYPAELRVALTAVRAAAALCMRVQEQAGALPVRKQDTSPVTVADFGSQALICRALQQAFPDDPVIAEESTAGLDGQDGLLDAIVNQVRTVVEAADRDQVSEWIDRGARHVIADRYWTVDPVDGTKGFLRGAQFAVALALVEDGRPIVSAVACPNLELGGMRGVVVSAVRGERASMAPLDPDGRARPLSVSAVSEAARARYCESLEETHSSHADAGRLARLVGIEKPPLRMDSQAKYAVVSHGDADYYLRLPVIRRAVENVWDHAAGSLLVEAAGGRVSDLKGDPLDFGHGPHLVVNRGIVASNGHLHDAILKAVDSLALSQPPGTPGS